jgi:hypothetical protein
MQLLTNSAIRTKKEKNKNRGDPATPLVETMSLESSAIADTRPTLGPGGGRADLTLSIRSGQVTGRHWPVRCRLDPRRSLSRVRSAPVRTTPLRVRRGRDPRSIRPWVDPLSLQTTPLRVCLDTDPRSIRRGSILCTRADHSFASLPRSLIPTLFARGSILCPCRPLLCESAWTLILALFAVGRSCVLADHSFASLPGR